MTQRYNKKFIGRVIKSDFFEGRKDSHLRAVFGRLRFRHKCYVDKISVQEIEKGLVFRRAALVGLNWLSL